ncbi:BolA/IbaG family iron-sulfur metabolism protein [Gammaproteobacteria bacterium LSUCC0112]|nr:BolA/IbaG family iron-sulfur metabolism protein [Gammaproteobacteria bacterium LSUCC0112]
MSIDAQTIKELLSAELPGCDIQVEGGGGKFQLAAVGSVFAGLGAVKRQQLIYQYLNAHIASGTIHAISMKLQTPEEAAS